MKNLKGYIFSRPFLGERVPQHIQNTILREYCKKKNIQVTNTPDVLTNDVSDLAIGFLISLSRKIIDNHNYTKKNKWLK